MSGLCIEVPPRSTKWIRNLAEALRDSCGIKQPWFPIVEFMDLTLLRDWDGYQFEVLDVQEMGGDAGRTYPDEKLVQIRADAYNNARRGDGFGRFTMAHELGHLFMHRGIQFARHVGKETVKPYRSSEWQANAFAAELLMPVGAVQESGGSIFLQGLCGVSAPAAEVRFDLLRREGLIG